MKRVVFLFCLASALFPPLAAGDKIQDNSFLIEEAYNQEPRVVQHIQSFQYLFDAGEWAYSFTQEWPMWGQKNQFSYTIPAVGFPEPDGGRGVGDIAVNYRYQAFMGENAAFSPRFSLVCPSGDHTRGYGTGGWGFQFNLPLSVDLSEKFTAHVNAGYTRTVGARNASDVEAQTNSFIAGGSLIYCASKKMNFMLESLYVSAESVGDDGFVYREGTTIVNPGVRFAIDFKSGLQIVPGVAVPVSVTRDGNDVGVFLYLSFEHPF